MREVLHEFPNDRNGTKIDVWAQQPAYGLRYVKCNAMGPSMKFRFDVYVLFHEYIKLYTILNMAFPDVEKEWGMLSDQFGMNAYVYELLTELPQCFDASKKWPFTNLWKVFEAENVSHSPLSAPGPIVLATKTAQPPARKSRGPASAGKKHKPRSSAGASAAPLDLSMADLYTNLGILSTLVAAVAGNAEIPRARKESVNAILLAAIQQMRN